MLSRLAARNVQVLSVGLRSMQNGTATTEPPRPVRLIDSSPVRHGFIPEEWFTFFYPKTGVTGPYAFMATFGTYLLSKEFYILEHEFYNSISLVIICVYGMKKYGKTVAEMLDKERDKYWQPIIEEKEDAIKNLELFVEELKEEISNSGLTKDIFDVKKQNIFMQLEAVYRERVAQVYSEVKKRLDYQLQLNTIERRIAQKHMIQWVLTNVLKSITPDQEKANLQQCISDLQALAARA